MDDSPAQLEDGRYAELLAAYHEMAVDREREAEAEERTEGLIGDGAEDQT